MMNRPTYPLTLAIAGLWLCTAQAQDPAAVARLTDFSDRYNECVYSSAISLVKSTNGDINQAAERGFASCSAEKDLMVSSMKAEGIPLELIGTTILEKQTGIKRELRKMMEEVFLKMK